MRATLSLLLTIALAGMGCSSTSDPSPTPPVDTGPWLRTTWGQALAPIDSVQLLPAVTITHDGVLLSPAPVPAIFPGPLVPPINARVISEAGRAWIVEQARAAGLLDGPLDFSWQVAPGQPTGTLRLAVDGRPLVRTGDVSVAVNCQAGRICDAPPGTPEAFAIFWSKIHDLGSWIPGELGPEGAWDPEAYAILVGPAPRAPAGAAPIRPQIADWPLPVALASFGQPFGGDGLRCGSVRGPDAAALRPALQEANQLTQWVQDETTSTTFGLTVRPLLPGDDACRDLLGG